VNNPRRSLQGVETLHGADPELPAATVLDFWRWAFGDLCHNNLRGIFAEWLVAQLLGIDLPRPVGRGPPRTSPWRTASPSR
jgi:hypothetical protein